MIEILKNSDWNKLPGLDAQLKMAPPTRKAEIQEIVSEKNYQPSSVLILLFEDENQWNTLLIKRATDNSPHSGQMALPGGRFEEKDISLKNTALRETFEEIGIPPEQIEIIGELSPIYIPVSKHKVVPFVGYVKKLPILILDKNEVDSVYIIAIKDLQNELFLKNDYLEIRNYRLKVPYYFIQNQIIWGATAMILSEFLEFLSHSIARKASE